MVSSCTTYDARSGAFLIVSGAFPDEYALWYVVAKPVGKDFLPSFIGDKQDTLEGHSVEYLLPISLENRNNSKINVTLNKSRVW